MTRRRSVGLVAPLRADFVRFPVMVGHGGGAMGRTVTVGVRSLHLGRAVADAIGFPGHVDIFYSEKAKMLAIRPSSETDARRMFRVKRGTSYQINFNHPFKMVFRVPVVIRRGTIFVKGIEYNDLMQESLR